MRCSEDEDLASAHLTIERITHNQRTACLNEIQLRKKELMETFQIKQRHVIEIGFGKSSLHLAHRFTDYLLWFHPNEVRI